MSPGFGVKKEDKSLNINNSITIHQPHFCPWIHLFTRIAIAEVYVVLDTVPYRHYYYQDRTKFIEANGKPYWFTLPLQDHKYLELKDACISKVFKFKVGKLIRQFKYNYNGYSSFKQHWPHFEKLLLNVVNYNGWYPLVNFNVECLMFLFQRLGINGPQIIRTSSLMLDDSGRTERIITICNRLEKNVLLLGKGGSISPHVHDLARICSAGIQPLSINNIDRNVNRGYNCKGISILHWLFTVGAESIKSHLINTIELYS